MISQDTQNPSILEHFCRNFYPGKIIWETLKLEKDLVGNIVDEPRGWFKYPLIPESVPVRPFHIVEASKLVY